MVKNINEEGEAARFRRDIRSLLRERVRKAIEVTLEEELSANFGVELERGPTLLHTWFDDENSEPIAGAYYIYVHRK